MSGSSPDDLREMVNQVHKKLKEPNAAERKIKIVVHDSIYGFITHQFPDTADGSYLRTQNVKCVGFALGKIAREYNVAWLLATVLLTYSQPTPMCFHDMWTARETGCGDSVG